MLKSLSALVLGCALMAETALACPCRCHGTAPSAPAAPAAETPAAPAQAQRPQATRSYSYQPSMQTQSAFGGGYRRGRGRITNSFGIRGAGSKANANY